jgi:hypothetical protein
MSTRERTNMKTCLLSVSVAIVLLTAPARADTVFLEDGTIIENVKATATQDGKVVVAAELGERVLAADRVRSIAVVEHFADKAELERRRDTTSDDVEQMRALVAWCETHGFKKEGRSAWRAWLDRSLAACSKAADYVDLAWKMNAAGFPDADRRRVLNRARKLDPENEGVKKALAELKGSDHVDEPEDTPFDERGLTPEGRAQVQAHKAAAAKERDHLAELALRVAEEDARHDAAAKEAREHDAAADRDRGTVNFGFQAGPQQNQPPLSPYGPSPYGNYYASGIDPTTGAPLVPWYALPGARTLSRFIDPTTGLPITATALAQVLGSGTASAQAQATVTPRPAPAPLPLTTLPQTPASLPRRK